jgi:tRNA (guanine37-N1)-methyltransferase
MSMLRCDAITIFPDYFAPLSLSLMGKAQSSGIVDIGVHDLRAFTDDAHRTVDDSPYGGGAGMVMKPEPWGKAIDQVATLRNAHHHLIVLTPAGRRFTQDIAYQFAGYEHLIFACGRYEGIDQRVSEYYSHTPHFTVHEISIGDYVLAGGESASLVMIEAIVRLLPGVLGNPESLKEESHSLTAGDEPIVEYPTYTKPPEWRGLSVPEILTSGNHGEIEKWRHSQARERTRRLQQ